jgi:small subunit ribosomal protein S21
LQVFVRENNVDQALRVLKKKMQREGVFREMKRRKAYEKPSERKTREKAEAIRRARKAARKQAQRDGLIPMPKRRDDARGGVGRGPGRFASGDGGPRSQESRKPL